MFSCWKSRCEEITNRCYWFGRGNWKGQFGIPTTNSHPRFEHNLFTIISNYLQDTWLLRAIGEAEMRRCELHQSVGNHVKSALYPWTTRSRQASVVSTFEWARIPAVMCSVCSPVLNFFFWFWFQFQDCLTHCLSWILFVILTSCPTHCIPSV